jgi:hypothetical protein
VKSHQIAENCDNRCNLVLVFGRCAGALPARRDPGEKGTGQGLPKLLRCASCTDLSAVSNVPILLLSKILLTFLSAFRLLPAIISTSEH